METIGEGACAHHRCCCDPKGIGVEQGSRSGLTAVECVADRGHVGVRHERHHGVAFHEERLDGGDGYGGGTVQVLCELRAAVGCACCGFAKIAPRRTPVREAAKGDVILLDAEGDAVNQGSVRRKEADLLSFCSQLKVGVIGTGCKGIIRPEIAR